MQLISLLLPTRGRPRLAERFFQSVVDNSTYPDAIEVILYVDDDDTQSYQIDCKDLQFHRIIGPRRTMGEFNSCCLSKARGDIIILVNDDMVIRTKGWDEKIRELDTNYPDKIYLAYGNDLFKGGKLCTFPILSRTTCELLADPYPAAYRGAFIDYHLLDIFKRLQHQGENRINYLPTVIFEHLHYRTGKAPIDSTYQQRGRFADDCDFLALTKARAQAANRLIAAIRGKETPAVVPFIPSRSMPARLTGMLVFITRFILLDRGLPWRWRGFLWYWFIGRQLAAHGLLRPFVK